MIEHEPPLGGLQLGISASETVAESGQGLTARELNRAMRHVAQAVLAQGGRLVFGHDWRSHGVMEEILDFAVSHRPVAQPDATQGPPITNFIAWPDRTTVSEEERAQYAQLLEIIEWDDESRTSLDQLDTDPGNLSARAGALTLMRRDMAAVCDACLCFGGKTCGSSGRYAGVVEEAAMALNLGRPLYITSLFGGASAQVVNAIRNLDTLKMPAFRPDPAIGEALSAFDPVLDIAVKPSIFAQNGVEGLSQLNMLSIEENTRLFDARHLGEVIGFLLVGLARIKAAKT